MTKGGRECEGLLGVDTEADTPGDYKLPVAKDHDGQTRRVGHCLVLSFLILVSIGVAALSTWLILVYPHHETHHRDPTLLSVYDGSQYVQALRNPLYEDAMSGTFYNEDLETRSDGIVLKASPSTLSPRANLTLQWSGPVTSKDVIFLLCTDNDEEELLSIKDASLILDAGEFTRKIGFHHYTPVCQTHSLSPRIFQQL